MATKRTKTGESVPDVQPDPQTGDYTEPQKAPLTSEDVPTTDSPEAPPAEPAEDERTVEELKDELRAKDLPVSGTKAELVARLAGEEAEAEPAGEPPMEPPMFKGDIEEVTASEVIELEPPIGPTVEDGPGDFVIGSRPLGGTSAYAADSSVMEPTEPEPVDPEEAADYEEVDKARFVGWNLFVIGEGFHAPGEIIIDVAREGGSDHQRFSAWTDDGTLDTPVPGISGVGVWEIHLEQVVTQVGEGNDEGTPTVLTTEPRQLEMY